jgi:hypothetical protein
MEISRVKYRRMHRFLTPIVMATIFDGFSVAPQKREIDVRDRRKSQASADGHSAVPWPARTDETCTNESDPTGGCMCMQPSCCLPKGLTLSSVTRAHAPRQPDAAGVEERAAPRRAAPAVGESVIKCPSPLNVLKDTYAHSCY